MFKFLVLPILMFSLSSSLVYAQGRKKAKKNESTNEQKVAILAKYEKYKKIYATIKTNMGDIVVELYPKEAPLAVDNFIELSEGTKEFIDVNHPKTVKTKRKFYDGLTFHRIAPNFVIQGGCPKGNGTSGPGYVFEDELNNSLNFGKKGMLAMANSGKDTNGSQFFITVRRLDKLLPKDYSIFGMVTEGMETVKKIERVPTYPNERPRKKIVINTIEIEKIAK